LSGRGIGHASNREVDPGQQRIRVLGVSSGSIGGHHVRSQNGGIEGDFALGDVTSVALIVIELRATRVVDAGREIDIVVTGPAGRPSGLAQEGSGLRGASDLAVTNFATARISGVDHRGKVTEDVHETRNLEGDAGRGRGTHDARQLRTHVDLMKENLGVQRVAGDRIDVLGLVAEYAHLHAVGITAMESQLIMAGVATLGADDIAGNSNGRAIGNEVEGRAGVAGAQVERREIAVAVDRDCSGHGGVESRGGLSDECVSVLARAYHDGSAAKFEIRAGDGSQHLAGRRRGGIGHVLCLTLGDIGGYIRQRNDAGRGGASSIQRQSVWIGESVRHTDCASAGDPGRVDGDHQTRVREINERSFVAQQMGLLPGLTSQAKDEE